MKRRSFTYKDTQKWVVKNYSGRILAKGFDGYLDASVQARTLGGVAVRM